MRLLEREFCKVDLANTTWGPRMFVGEFVDKVVSIDVVGICPSVFFIPKPFPGDKVLELATEESAVQGFFNFPTFFTIDNFRFWDRSPSVAGNGSRGVGRSLTMWNTGWMCDMLAGSLRR